MTRQARQGFTLDQALRPIEVQCTRCGGPALAIPDHNQGATYCATCSPAWFLSFQTFRMNAVRAEHGLEPVEVAGG